MKAVVIRRHGGPEVLEVAELPVPEPGPGEVRIGVRACALNHLDLWVRKGWPQLALPMPHLLGADISGVVDALGAGVASWQVGAEVVVNPGISCGACEACLLGRDHFCRSYQLLGEDRGGGYAEYMVVPAQNLLAKPKNLSFAEAACIPVTFLTAWEMIVNRAEVHPGEWVLVLAAGSGVGIAAVQIAKLAGATVIATASSDAKLSRARELGADHGVNYSNADFAEEVRRITDKRGVDVVIEHTGAATFGQSFRALARGGRMVTCGATSGPQATFDLRYLFLRKLSILGSTMGRKGDLITMMRFFEQGKLRPVLDRVLPLERAAEGHRVLAERAQFGKVVLVP
jgi:NADPH:quinone reductase-like Zn-dependent oxidoreductase